MIRDAKENKSDDKKKSLIILFNGHGENIKNPLAIFDIKYLHFTYHVHFSPTPRMISMHQVNDSGEHRHSMLRLRRVCSHRKRLLFLFLSSTRNSYRIKDITSSFAIHI